MKKLTAIILVFIMLLSTTAFAADFTDMPNDWSTSALEATVKNGLLTGSYGRINPSHNLTRAEMAAIMVRATGATKSADISTFTDVKKDEWYYDYMSKAVAMGAFAGDGGKLRPNSPITRQEAFLVLSRVFGLMASLDAKPEVLDQFKDRDKIADWAEKGILAMVARGYVAGDNGNIKPLVSISRAEFAVVMDRLVKYYIDDFSDNIPEDGNMMIRIPAKSIADLKTDKMIILGDGMGDAEIVLKNTTADKLVVRGAKKVTLSSGTYNEVSVVSAGITLDGASSKIQKAYVCKDSKFILPTMIDGESEDASN